MTDFIQDQIYIVKEDGKNIRFFLRYESAEEFMNFKTEEYKENFVSSSWMIKVDDSNNAEGKYFIKKFRFYFGIIYYESVVKIFEIEKHPVFE